MGGAHVVESTRAEQLLLHGWGIGCQAPHMMCDDLQSWHSCACGFCAVAAGNGLWYVFEGWADMYLHGLLQRLCD